MAQKLDGGHEGVDDGAFEMGFFIDKNFKDGGFRIESQGKTCFKREPLLEQG